MCDPTSLIGVALSGASVVANSAAQSAVAKARSNAMTAERYRQRQYDQEADALNAKSQTSYTGFEGQQAEKGKSLGDYFNQQNLSADDKGAMGAGTPTETQPGVTSNIVLAEQQKQRGKAEAFSNQQGTALGNLRSFGDLMGDLGRSQARDAGYIGQIGGFKKGSSAVLPYELEEANSAGSGLRMLGDIAGAGGKIMTSAGLLKDVGPKVGTIPSMTRPLPTAPLTLGSQFGPLPTFAQKGGLYGVR